MQNVTATYSRAEATRREREYLRERRNRVLGVMIGLTLIGANVALFIYRDEVADWARKTFGEIELVVNRSPGTAAE